MCFGGGGGRKQKAPEPTVDPEAERRAAEAQAAANANKQILADAKRKRVQKGLVAGAPSDELAAGSVLAAGKPKSTPANVLGAGGM